MKYLIDLDDLSGPGEQMRIRVSRRGLITAAAEAAEERKRSREGLPSYRIEDVAAFPDQQLAEISRKKLQDTM